VNLPQGEMKEHQEDRQQVWFWFRTSCFEKIHGGRVCAIELNKLRC